MLRLSSGSVMSRFGGYREGARGLLRRADSVLSKELKTVRASEIALSSFTFGVLQGKFKASGGLTAFGLPVDSWPVRDSTSSASSGSRDRMLTTCTPSETAPWRPSSRRRATGWVNGGLRAALSSRACPECSVTPRPRRAAAPSRTRSLRRWFAPSSRHDPDLTP